MFTKRIIPCLDVNNGRVVKGINFLDLRDAGDPVEVGADGNGGITNNAKDDSHAGDPSGTKPLGESKDNAASNV